MKSTSGCINYGTICQRFEKGMHVYDFFVRATAGKTIPLDQYKGMVSLIVNRCPIRLYRFLVESKQFDANNVIPEDTLKLTAIAICSDPGGRIGYLHAARHQKYTQEDAADSR